MEDAEISNHGASLFAQLVSVFLVNRYRIDDMRTQQSHVKVADTERAIVIGPAETTTNA